MATPNPEELREALGRDHPGPWVEHLLGAFPAEYRAAFDAEDLSRHLGLMRQLGADRPIRLAASPLGDGTGTWRVEVVGYDAFQLLATVCTLLAIQRLSIVEARIFTADPPPEEADRDGRPARRPARRPGQGPGGRSARDGPPGRGGRARPPPEGRRRLPDPSGRGRRPARLARRFERELSDLAQLLRQGQHDEVYHRLIGRFAAALGAARRRRGPGVDPPGDRARGRRPPDPGPRPGPRQLRLPLADGLGPGPQRAPDRPGRRPDRRRRQLGRRHPLDHRPLGPAGRRPRPAARPEVRPRADRALQQPAAAWRATPRRPWSTSAGSPTT